MKNNLSHAGLALTVILSIWGCKPPDRPRLTAGTSERFSAGQVWTYKTRPSETGSRLLIGRVDSVDGKNVVHIKITGLAIQNPMKPGAPQPVLGHAPISEEALADSVVAKIADTGDLAGFQEGYDEWRSSFDKGQGGFFTVPVADIPATIEEALAAVKSGKRQ